jgi:hypothetical protein
MIYFAAAAVLCALACQGGVSAAPAPIAAHPAGPIAASTQSAEEYSYPLPHPDHIFELQQHSPAPSAHTRRLGKREPELTPTYPGYGSHFLYLYMGSPPQRQAVMLDTGSEYTAFPCSDCKDCGKHIDEYFKPDKSNSYAADVCNGKKCIVQNQYSTANWKAYTGKDTVFIAGNDMADVTDAIDYKFKVQFGCMTSIDADAKSRPAAGTLGLARSENTFTSQYAKKTGVDNVFSLCFRQGGGIFTLGGVDPRVQNVGSDMLFTKLSNHSFQTSDGFSKRFWTVKVDKLSFKAHNAAPDTLVSIASPALMAAFDAGKGTVIDSGTSQSYFPKAIAASLAQAFKTASGLKLVNKPIKLTPAQFKALPTLVYTLKADKGGKSFDVEVPKTSYVESNGNDMYSIMLLATEENGAVLGTNFMEG